MFFTLSREDFNGEVVRTRDKVVNYKIVKNNYEELILGELDELTKIIKMYGAKLPKDFVSINVMCELINICKLVFDGMNQSLNKFTEHYTSKFENEYDVCYINKLLF